MINFIETYSLNSRKKCLIIDDEADTTGIGYQKATGSDKYTLRAVSSKVNQMRGTLDDCVFVEVTATPYSLYLQPDFSENTVIKPIKPVKTVLVPCGKDYIGGEYYFLKSKDELNPASLIFEPMSQEECDLVSDQKRKGKKNKIDDRRSFKIEEIITNENRLSTFKKGIVNFIVGVVTLRKIYENDERYAFVIHTAMQKDAHFTLGKAAEELLRQIRNRTVETKPLVQKLVVDAYEDIKKSVEQYKLSMPKFQDVEDEFYKFVDDEYYSIDVVNGDNDISSLLNEESGELNLRTPCSIFVGGQLLDRGVTIHNMIGFYYGRNPKDMQYDTVLQHSRMFGYRKKLLPVTRFYTTERIYSNMEKITEIDEMLRDDISKGELGDGVYFITNKSQDEKFEKGSIKPCSPDKILISNIILLKAYQRILPVGFSPVTKSLYQTQTLEIDKLLKEVGKLNDYTYEITLNQASELIKFVYATIKKDEESIKFVTESEMITALEYFAKENATVYVQVYRNMNLSKYKKDGIKYQDSPDTASTHLSTAKKFAKHTPVLMLFQENGEDASWNNRPFWWPVLIAPENVPNSIYASKIEGEKIVYRRHDEGLGIQIN